MAKKNEPHDVFLNIDMHEGNPVPCWEWTKGLGGREGDKRPYFSVNGKRILAYRLVYELYYGELPDDTKVRHKCDNPKCCNPHHLLTGTQSDNEQDKYERDRVGIPLEIVQYIKETKATLPMLTSSRMKDMVKQKFGYEIAASSIRNITSGNRRVGHGEDKPDDVS